MDYTERELTINKIVSGCTICNFGDEQVLVYEASPHDKVIAQNIYSQQKRTSELLGSLSEAELMQEMRLRGMWSDLLEGELEKIPKSLEDLKIELYNAYFQFKRRDQIKKSIHNLRLREIELMQQKERLFHTTSEGFAISCKNKHIICSATKKFDGTPFFVNGYEKYSQSMIDMFIRDYFTKKVDGNIIRQLSQEEPWRSIWSAGKSEGSLFGKPATLLSQDQRLLLVWSKIYDSIAESSDCPPNEVMDDEDCLDGWMMIQSRKRDQERQAQHGYKPGDKFNKADEVFLFVDNPDDAARVNAMNSPAAIFRKQQRMSALDRAGGKLEDQYMPDAQQTMRTQLIQMMNNQGKK